MSNRMVWFSFIVIVAVATIPSRSRNAEAAVGPPNVAWKDLTYDQKKAFMKAAVVPALKPVFQKFDPKKFKNVTCATCHGDDGTDRKYKMPSNDIAPLPSTPEAFQAKMKKEADWPKWTQFMSDKVVPAMGKVLNVPVFDHKKPVEGTFSCNACHKLEKP